MVAVGRVVCGFCSKVISLLTGKSDIDKYFLIVMRTLYNSYKNVIFMVLFRPNLPTSYSKSGWY